MKPLYKAIDVYPKSSNHFEIYKFNERVNERVNHEIFCTIYSSKENVDLIVAALNAYEPKIKGYKLIKKYPGCSVEIGHFSSVGPSSFYKDYPEFWQPIYE